MASMTPEEALAELVDFVLEELGTDDDDRIAKAVDHLLASIDRPLAFEDAQRLLATLRSLRLFPALGRVADRLIEVGSGEALIRRQYAQALIDQGFLGPALIVLEEMLKSLPEGHDQMDETLGLLGRVHKQRFVRAGSDRERAASALGQAIRYYRQAYPLNPAWHGANLVALVHRANREGIYAEDLALKDTVAMVLEDLIDLPPESYGSNGHWIEAGIGETYLGDENFERASHHYGRFIQHEKTDAFALGSAARQLREIWQIEPGEESRGGTILLAIDATLVGEPGGGLRYSPSDMAKVSSRIEDELDGEGPDSRVQLQALLGDNPQLSLKTLLTLLDRAPAVCRVVDGGLFEREIPSGGSGFLVERRFFRPGEAGPPLLVTNSHVLSETGTGTSIRRQAAKAVFDFWNADDQRETFTISKILWHSPVRELDAVVAELDMDESLVAEARDCAINQSTTPLNAPGHDPKDKVYLIGHPAGRGLEFSLADNEVVDHDIGDPAPSARGRRRIHYRAPSEPGSSGSPVFDQDEVQVIGLHRAASKLPLRDDRDGADYVANEAVWFQSIIEAFRRETCAEGGAT